MDVFLRMTLLREREERQKAQEINKQLEECGVMWYDTIYDMVNREVW